MLDHVNGFAESELQFLFVYVRSTFLRVCRYLPRADTGSPFRKLIYCEFVCLFGKSLGLGRQPCLEFLLYFRPPRTLARMTVRRTLWANR